jgi:hypothetical protein
VCLSGRAALLHVPSGLSRVFQGRLRCCQSSYVVTALLLAAWKAQWCAGKGSQGRLGSECTRAELLVPALPALPAAN